MYPSKIKRPITEYFQERVLQQPENPFAALIPDQTIAIIPSFTLESGVTLQNVPLAYSTRGKLSPNRDNCMVICHALTGSADVSDWRARPSVRFLEILRHMHEQLRKPIW
jgi:homoserine acetyltransferase